MRKTLIATALVAVAFPAFAQQQPARQPANPDANTPAVNSQTVRPIRARLSLERTALRKVKPGRGSRRRASRMFPVCRKTMLESGAAKPRKMAKP